MRFLSMLSVFTLILMQVACADMKKSNEAVTATTTPVTSSRAGGGFVEEKLKFKVTGMHCGGCAKTIEAAVEKVPGVAEVSANFKSGEVLVISSGPSRLDRQAVIKAIESADASGTFKVTQ